MNNLSDDILKYKKGELTAAQMHALEKKALADPFLSEALEGIEKLSVDELAQALAAIHEKIDNRKENILFTPLRIAAGIVLLVGSVLLIYQFVPKPEILALKTEKPKPENKSKVSKEKNEERGKDVTNNKAEREKLKAKKNHELGHLQTSASKNPTSNIQKPDEKPAEVLPPKGLASADTPNQPSSKISADEKQKESVKEEERVEEVKSVARNKKKESLAASQVQRAASQAKIKITKSISGQVVSAEDGLPLPGVNVTVRGASISTVTDLQGNYSIPAKEGKTSLLFSLIGLQSREVDAAGRDKINVQLKDDDTQLSEVVVMGFSNADHENVEPIIKLTEPLGGEKAYIQYLESNLKFPEAALKNKIKGKAGIQFKVNADGSLSDFQIIKKLGDGCEEEIIRLIKGGPKWTPSEKNGKSVESTVRVRLKFDPAKAGNNFSNDPPHK